MHVDRRYIIYHNNSAIAMEIIIFDSRWKIEAVRGTYLS